MSCQNAVSGCEYLNEFAVLLADKTVSPARISRADHVCHSLRQELMNAERKDTSRNNKIEF